MYNEEDDYHCNICGRHVDFYEYGTKELELQSKLDTIEFVLEMKISDIDKLSKIWNIIKGDV